MNERKLVSLLPLLAASILSAQTVAPPYAGTYTVQVLGSITTLPTSYGGLTFKAGDPQTILIGGAANAATGRFYEVPVVRTPAGTGHISAFGTPVAKGFGANNDGGIAYGPGGVLFYSKYNVNQVGQVRPGSNAEDKTVSLGPLGVAVSPGALTFVPPGFGGSGRLKLCSYSGGQFYDAAVGPDGTGTYNILSATQTATLANGPEGFIYAPAGSPLFPNATLLVTEYGSGKIAAYDADANGNPLVASRRDFLTGLTGGEGATIDPITGDFLFSTFGSTNRVVQVRGFNPPPPTATVALSSSANPSFVGNSVTFTAAITGVAPITGAVTFKNNGVDVAGCTNVVVASNQAQCATAALVIGRHPIVAYYGGSSTNGAANSPTLTQRVLAQPPGGVGTGNRLWLDASDPTTLFGDSACTQLVTTSGNDVACWLDKSGDGSDVKDVGPSNGEPTFLTNQFNGKAALEFKKAESDTLRHVIGTPWSGPFTEFVVFQQVGAPEEYDSFFSNGDAPDATHHQITFRNGSFAFFTTGTPLAIEPVSNELKLYAVRGGGAGTEVFSDGALRNQSASTEGRTFSQYRVNQNRSGGSLNNSRIAEVIVYDRALTNCEVEQVSLYLGTKYGRDFLDVSSGWDWTAPFVNDVNGIASISTAFCGTPRLVDTAQSSIVTIDSPTGLDPGESLLIGHDGAGLGTAPAFGAYDARLNQLWRVDANQPLNPGIAVRVSFDVTATNGAVDVSNPSLLALLVWDSASPPPAVLAQQVTGASVAGNVVSFAGVTFQHGQYFTLAHALPPGLFVQNAGPVSYPSLGTPVVVAPNLRVSFINPATPIDAARVDVSANFQAGADVLGVQGQSGTSGTVNGLAWSWDATAGVLTLTGNGNAATYQAALRQITYHNTSGSPSTAQRKITFSLGSGLQFPGTGHFYEYVASAGINWSNARAAAAAKNYFGLQGYLVTVTSQGESDFVLNKLQGRQGWIGATNGSVASDWRWVTGPEGLESGGQGRLFYQNGAPVGGAFTNWQPGEPNGGANGAAYFIGVGCTWGGCRPSFWDDIYVPDPNVGFVVEYGGLPADPVLHIADDAFVNILTPRLTLSKTKTSPAGDVDVATNVTYTLAFSITGGAAAKNVVLRDVIPPGATFVSASGGGVHSGNTVEWGYSSLPSGYGGAVTVTVTAPSAAGTMTNTADIGAANAPTVQATRSVNVVGPTLTLQKAGPAGVAASGQITYTLTCGNTGTGSAASPVLVDTFPAGTSYASATPVPTSQTATSATWNLAAIASGSSAVVTLTLNAPAAPGTITNSASLSATAATPVTASAASRVTTCANASVPCLTKGFLPGTIPAGSGTSTLTLAIENGTDGLAHAVSLTDSLPAGLELAAVPASPQCGGTVSGTTGGTTVTVANAGVGGANPQSCAITATVRGTSGGTKVNDATRFSGTGNSVDVSGARATLVVTQPVLALSKTAVPASVLVGGTVTYLLEYRNTGNGAALGAQLTDTLPAGATYVSSTPAGSLAGSTLTWPLGDLAAGATGPVSVVVKAPGAPTTLTNTSSLTASNAATANANATVKVFGEPAFTLAVTDSPDPVRAGTDLTYTLTLTNTGTLAASGTTVSLPLPASTTFVSASAGGTFGGGTVSWSLGSLGVGQPTSVAATVHVASPLANGTVLSTSGQANATNLASPVSAPVTTTVLSEPKLAVTLTAAPPLVQGGETVSYVIGFSNQGTDVAAGASLTFTAPPSTTIEAAGDGTVSGPTVTWSLGALAVGQAGSLSVTVRTDSGVPNGAVLVANGALASSTTCGSPAAPCAATADATVTVATAPLLSLAKTGPAYVAAGGSVTYELTYANDGNLDAQNVVLSDLLPTDTEFVSATASGTCGDGQTPPDT